MASVKYCIICGQGSHRTDWRNVSGNLVACDHHSKEEFAKAVGAAPKTAAPVAGTTSKATVVPAKMAPIPAKK